MEFGDFAGEEKFIFHKFFIVAPLPCRGSRAAAMRGDLTPPRTATLSLLKERVKSIRRGGNGDKELVPLYHNPLLA